MEGYTFGLVFLTLLATLHYSACASVTRMTLTEHSVFSFRCDVSAPNALDLFQSPLQYFFYNPVTDTTVQMSQNSKAIFTGWTASILQPSNGTFFPFELSGTVDLTDSGTYYCTRGPDFNKTIVLTVEKQKMDVGKIDFSISAVDELGKPIGEEEIFVIRPDGEADPDVKEVNIDSGYYQARCNAKGGIPPPQYTLQTGDTVLAFQSMKKVLLNSANSDISCHVETGVFTHHLQFNLVINPGHPSLNCQPPTTMVGATDAEIACLVTGDNLNCSHLSWISETDMSVYNQKANYSVECELSNNRSDMKYILKLAKVKKADFEDGFILKFENHLNEAYQKVFKLKEKPKPEGLNAGTNVAPMGIMSVLFLSILGLLL